MRPTFVSLPHQAEGTRELTRSSQINASGTAPTLEEIFAKFDKVTVESVTKVRTFAGDGGPER